MRPSRLPRSLALALALALPAALACRTAGPVPAAPGPVAARAPLRPPAAVRIVTSDIAAFWRAYDLAAGRDSAARVAIFQHEYLDRGSEGLREFARLKLALRAGAGTDTLAPAVVLERTTAHWPRFYAAIRARTLALDTASAVADRVRGGLARLAALAPGARFPDVYLVVGSLTSGGTASAHGMLIGADVFAGGMGAPVGELPSWARAKTEGSSLDDVAYVVLHEAVHVLQPPDCCRTLLQASLAEGGADFLAGLAGGGDALRNAAYQRYGRAHESEVWAAFRRDMRGADTRGWLASWAVRDNHGAPDLGYWVGYRIAQAYYARAADRPAAVRALLALDDPEAILRESGYGEGLVADQ